LVKPSAPAKLDSQLRKHARQIFDAALKAADPVEAVRRHLRVEGDVLIAGRKRYRLDSFERVWILGAGKASAAMVVEVIVEKLDAKQNLLRELESVVSPQAVGQVDDSGRKTAASQAR